MVVNKWLLLAKTESIAPIGWCKNNGSYGRVKSEDIIGWLRILGSFRLEQ